MSALSVHFLVCVRHEIPSDIATYLTAFCPKQLSVRGFRRITIQPMNSVSFRAEKRITSLLLASIWDPIGGNSQEHHVQKLLVSTRMAFTQLNSVVFEK